MMFWKEQTQRPLPQTIRSNGLRYSPLTREPSTTPRNKKICVVALLRCCVVTMVSSEKPQDRIVQGFCVEMPHTSQGFNDCKTEMQENFGRNFGLFERR